MSGKQEKKEPYDYSSVLTYDGHQLHSSWGKENPFAAHFYSSDDEDGTWGENSFVYAQDSSGSLLTQRSQSSWSASALKSVFSHIKTIIWDGVIPDITKIQYDVGAFVADYFYSSYEHFYTFPDLLSALYSYGHSGLSPGLPKAAEVIIIIVIFLYIAYISRSMYRQDYTFLHYLNDFRPYFTSKYIKNMVMTFFKKKSSKQGGSATQGGLKIKSNRRQKQRGGTGQQNKEQNRMKDTLKWLCRNLLIFTTPLSFRIYKAFNWLHYNMLSGKFYLFITCLLCLKQFTNGTPNEISAFFAKQTEVEKYHAYLKHQAEYMALLQSRFRA